MQIQEDGKWRSDMLYASNNPNTLKAIVGEELTKDFVSFCKTPTITVQDVISGNYTEQDLKNGFRQKIINSIRFSKCR